jgi:ribonuclease J
MSLAFKIHRGAKETGSSFVEVWTDTSRIVIDIGDPLANHDQPPFDAGKTDGLSTDDLIRRGILPDIPPLYQDTPNTAVLFSHSRQYPYSLLDYMYPSCPVWMGKARYKLLDLINDFAGNRRRVTDYHFFNHYATMSIGDITITAFPMDSVAVDAFAFLITAGGKSLVYTGDFRCYGREAGQFKYFCATIKKKADYLLLGGGAVDGDDLTDEFIQTFRQTKGINLVYAPVQNISRIKSLYAACEKCSKILLMDFYTANVLKTLHKKVPDGSVPFPSRESYINMNVYFPTYLSGINTELERKYVHPFNIYKIGYDELNTRAEKLVMLVSPRVKDDLDSCLDNWTDGTFIYSMYSGYTARAGETKDFLDFIAGKGMPIADIHTSGSADAAGLKRMVEAVQPKHLVPIHTEGGQYAELFAGTDVRAAHDRETVEV